MNQANDGAADVLAVDVLPELDAPGGPGGEDGLLGRVAAPPNKESTSDFFYFWVERGQLVERGQIVTTSSSLGGRTVEFVGLIEEVYRQSRQRDMGEEVDRYDDEARNEPPFKSAGFSYAKVTINAGSLGNKQAKPIVYGLTIPSNAPDPALAEKFIGFVLGPQGQAIMRSNGFVVINPALASSQGKVPAALQPLTTQWPGG